MKKGMISVIMGIRNCSNTLPEAIDAILGQTYTDWELILCDDASTDNTYEIAEEYHRQYPNKIKLFRHDTNLYLAQSLNDCLKLAEGEYIARMDGDDKCLPERFEKQVSFLKTHPEIVLCGTAMQRFSDNGLGAIDSAPSFPNRYTLHKETPFKHATIIAYKSLFDALNGYTVCDRTIRGQDQDLWYRFFSAGYKGANLQEALYMVREDEAAIRRRTPKDYWISFQTTIYGYGLLKYPKHWYIKPILNLSKALVPVGLVMKYREWQKKKQFRRVNDVR